MPQDLAYPKVTSNTVKRLPHRANYDPHTIHSIVNSTRTLHVAFNPSDPSEGPFPVILPMIGQMGSFEYPSSDLHDPLDCYLHGHVSSRVMKLASSNEGKGLPVSIAATRTDGLILSLTPFSHSYNYRSVVLFGYAKLVTAADEKLWAMELITNSVVPGRWGNTRVPPTGGEVSSTSILRVKIVSASGKIREGGPHDEKKDLHNEGLTARVWTGVVPMWETLGEPIAGTPNRVKEAPEYLKAFIRTGNERDESFIRASMNSSTLRRLAADHSSLHRAGLPPYYLFPATDASSHIPDDLSKLTVLLTGPQGTPYSEGLWKLCLTIPNDYPKSPPRAAFRTRIWHPNVEENTGHVCVDTLKRDWDSNLTLRHILITISCLLIHPNPDSALNASAGHLLHEDFESFARQAQLMASIHARIPKNLQEEVLEAKRRGEDDSSNSSDTDTDDEASASKENDPSLSPSPVPVESPRISTSTKRPLSDLPTPTEPKQDLASPSGAIPRANVSTTSPSSSAPLGLSMDEPTSSLKLAQRSRGVNLATRAIQDAGQNRSIIIPFDDRTISDDDVPAPKRICSREGKENGFEALGICETATPATRPVLASGNVYTARLPVVIAKKQIQSVVAGCRTARPRVGLRRL